jgi:hypothetical protein
VAVHRLTQYLRGADDAPKGIDESVTHASTRSLIVCSMSRSDVTTAAL